MIPAPSGLLTDQLLAGHPARPTMAHAFTVREARNGHEVGAYERLRRDVFVREQGLFDGSDRDDLDDAHERIVLVAVAAGGTDDGTVIGGVRLTPGAPGLDLAWWTGSRLAVSEGRRGTRHVGAALIEEACRRAVAKGALRFDATVQLARVPLFERLGWRRVGATVVAGQPHARMRWPIARVQQLVDATKAPLGEVLDGLAPGGAGWVGDDAAPVPGSDLLAACDGILPAMVARDPWWAGWCSVLVNANDLAAKGAAPLGLLDALAGPTASFAKRVMGGIRSAAGAWGVPVLGGHTTLGVPASLSVSMLGRAERPVPAGGARVGDTLEIAADLTGSWRPGYEGRQWDSTTARSGEELRHLHATVARRQPKAAKDISMAGLLGTVGMLAEANGCGARIDLTAVPRPAEAGAADWLTCFPGFGMVVAVDPHDRSTGADRSEPAPPASCGQLRPGSGVDLRWPDGEIIRVVDGATTNLGVA